MRATWKRFSRCPIAEVEAALDDPGVIGERVGPTRIAASLGCSRTSVYRLSGRW
jgi:hypothetical protein